MPIVYLIQPAELVGTNRYKIGKSSKDDLSRIKSYKLGSRHISIMNCDNHDYVETMLIDQFNFKYKKVAGNEYFEGDENDMLKTFNEIVINKKINQQLKTNTHLNNHFGCKKCMKVFKDMFNLTKHLNRKTSCVSLETLVPVTINVTQNFNDNSINLNNENYINFEPTDFKGNKFKLFRQIKNNSDSSFFSESNIQSLTNNILKLINKSNFDEIKENKITEDILNSNDSDLIKSKIKKFNNLCEKNDLLKEFAPRISENNPHDSINNKLRLYPHLIINNELDECKEFIDDYK